MDLPARLALWRRGVASARRLRNDRHRQRSREPRRAALGSPGERRDARGLHAPADGRLAHGRRAVRARASRDRPVRRPRLRRHAAITGSTPCARATAARSGASRRWARSRASPSTTRTLDVVYFGSNDGALYAVHASDGRLAWRYESGAEVARRPVLSGESLYFANAADNLFAVDRRSGKALWHVHRTPALGMEISGYAGPALDRGTIFFAFSDGHVGAYDAVDGTEKWAPVDLSAEAEQAQGGETLRYLDVDTTPIPDDLGSQGRVVFVASYAGGVFALDEDRGATVWKVEKAIGVTDLTLWRERAHAPNPGSADYVADGEGPPRAEPRDPPRVERRERSLGARAGRRDGRCGESRFPRAESRRRRRWPVRSCGTTNYGAFSAFGPRDGKPIDGFRPWLRFAGAGDVRHRALVVEQRRNARGGSGRAADAGAAAASLLVGDARSPANDPATATRQATASMFTHVRGEARRAIMASRNAS